MNIQAFADSHRLKTRLDSCGDKNIEGRTGQIYEYSEDRLAVMFMPPSKTDRFGRWCPRIWNKFREAGKALGMTVQQNGDSEGCLLFDSGDKRQVKLACQIAKIRPRRLMSPEAKAKLVNAGLLTRRTALEGPLAF